MATKRKIVIVVVLLAVILLIVVRISHKARAPFAPSSVPLAGSAGSAKSSRPCVDFHQATSHVGENGCISGYVLRAYTSKAGNTFLDFCQDYRTCPFTSVIFASDHNKFGNLETLEGRQVELHGFISTYHDQAEIIIHDPQQIQVAQ